MSWHFSRALGGVFLAENFSAGAQFARSSGTPQHEKNFWPDKTITHSRRSRSGPMSDLSPHEITPCAQPSGRFAASAINSSSRADFHAQTSVLPATAKDWTVRNLVSGASRGASLARYDRATCSWKTHQRLLLEEGFESLEILPPWGMTAGGELYPLPMPSGLLAHRASITSESGSGLPERAPTRTVSGNYNRKGASAQSGDGLATWAAVRRLPTPQAYSKGDSDSRPGLTPLDIAVRPEMARHAERAKERRRGIPRVPTPTTQDASNNGPASQMERNTKPLNAEVGGPLNPRWVEWLMGWPDGWTDSHASVTAKCLTRWLWHGKSSTANL
jgi:hypothetical protein